MPEPAITRRAVHDDGPGNPPVYRIVLHLTSGSTVYPDTALPPAALGTARYFQDPVSGGSAHYVHDAGPVEEHCVPDDVVAWHAPPNRHSIGQEICGHPAWSRDQFLDDRVRPALDHAAARTAELCDRWAVPKVKIDAGQLLGGAHGVTGHDSVSQAWRQSTHWDPGPNFPWDYFMAQVNGGRPVPPPTPPPSVTPMVPPWPFGNQYVGDIRGPAASHGGFFAWERPFIQTVQRWLVFLGCADVPSSSWPWTSWADGLFQAPWSTNALIRFHDRFYGGQPYRDRLYVDDWSVLVRSRP